MCLFSNFDVNLLANCLGLECVPVFKNNLYDLNKIFDLRHNINYVIEPKKWGDIINIYELAKINKKYFQENILHTNIMNNLFNKLYTYSQITYNNI